MNTLPVTPIHSTTLQVITPVLYISRQVHTGKRSEQLFFFKYITSFSCVMYTFQPQILNLGVCSFNLDMLSISDLLENALQDELLNINLVLLIVKDYREACACAGPLYCY